MDELKKRPIGGPFWETIDETGQARWGIDFEHKEVIASQLAQKLAADTENKIRDALIEMGWTPPKSE